MIGSDLFVQAAVPEEDILPPPTLQYRGTKYTDDPRFKDLQAAFPAVWRRAWIRVREALGLRYQDYGPGHITLRLEDLPRRSKGADFASTGGRRGRQDIMLRAEHLLNGYSPFEEVLTHELTHAVLRHSLGNVHDRLPSWTRESLAMWVAGQGPSMTGWILGRALETENPLVQRNGPIVNGLAGHRHTGTDLVEDVLTIEFLHQTLGQEKFGRWIHALVEGTEAEPAVEQLTGMGWEDFCQKARRYVEDRLQEDLKNVHAPFRRAHQAVQEKRYEEAAGQFREITKNHPTHWAAAWCLLYESQCWFHLQKWEEALRCFKELNLSPHLTVLLFQIPGLKVKLMHTYEKLGKREEALAERERFLKDHADVPLKNDPSPPRTISLIKRTISLDGGWGRRYHRMDALAQRLALVQLHPLSDGQNHFTPKHGSWLNLIE